METWGPRAAAALVLLCGLTEVHDSIAADGRPGDDALSDSGAPKPAIHATRLDYSAWDVPEAVTVITRDDIRREKPPSGAAVRIPLHRCAWLWHFRAPLL